MKRKIRFRLVWSDNYTPRRYSKYEIAPDLEHAHRDAWESKTGMKGWPICGQERKSNG